MTATTSNLTTEVKSSWRADNNFVEESPRTFQKLSDAADGILRDSFAVYEVNGTTAKIINAAWLAAKRYFESGPHVKNVVNGQLHGFHEPTSAKFLFRSFCFSSNQPWPNEEMRHTSQCLAREMHGILETCYREMEAKLNGPVKTRKRPRMFHDIPHSADESLDSPLDYFLYHGVDSAVPNCTPHVDRGVLLAVCLTRVPGLEVQPRGQKRWVCPETALQHEGLFRDADDAPMKICILAGDSLSTLLGHEERTSACVHRVKDRLRCARLSITYEIRLSESKRQR